MNLPSEKPKLLLLAVFALLSVPSLVNRARGEGAPGLQSRGPTAAQSPAPAAAKQTVLGPGLYVFQTRVRNSSCGDAEPDGYVTSYMASIDGVPGAIEMTMDIVNTAHFKTWQLKVTNNQDVLGESRLGTGVDAPDSHFEVRLEKDRFKGIGSRSYNANRGGKVERCRVNYDALLRRLDDR